MTSCVILTLDELTRRDIYSFNAVIKMSGKFSASRLAHLPLPLRKTFNRVAILPREKLRIRFIIKTSPRLNQARVAVRLRIKCRRTYFPLDSCSIVEIWRRKEAERERMEKKGKESLEALAKAVPRGIFAREFSVWSVYKIVGNMLCALPIDFVLFSLLSFLNAILQNFERLYMHDFFSDIQN